MPPLADILHRTLVVGLLGVTVTAVGTGWAVHKDTHLEGDEVRKSPLAVERFALCALCFPPCVLVWWQHAFRASRYLRIPLVYCGDHELTHVLHCVLQR